VSAKGCSLPCKCSDLGDNIFTRTDETGKTATDKKLCAADAYRAQLGHGTSFSDTAWMLEQWKPVLIICQEDPQCLARLQSLDSCKKFRFGWPLYFPTAIAFTRWLFAQPRGAVVPWCVLLAGWREAQPCAAAVVAAKTGDISGLRADAKRPPLSKEVSDGKNSSVSVAVAGMLILPQGARQEHAAIRWADNGWRKAAIPIYVARPDDTLDVSLDALAKTFTPSRVHLSL